jgi:hypothetical protein
MMMMAVKGNIYYRYRYRYPLIHFGVAVYGWTVRRRRESDERQEYCQTRQWHKMTETRHAIHYKHKHKHKHKHSTSILLAPIKPSCYSFGLE